jgi:pimeloyl-ACP methyl ester carboxylesterase
LLVVVHGTGRQTGGYLRGLKEFSEEHNCAVLCPLFPAGIVDPDDLHNYKAVVYKDIRFDLILLSMIDQAAQTWRLRTDKFFLRGFSGGGQFAHRFFYLHPERIAGVSIGAPGRLTPPDTTKPWPAGLSNICNIFGVFNAPNFHHMARVPVQFIVGEKDVDTSLLETVKEPNAAEKEAGKTRVERIRWLKAALESKGVTSELKVVRGVGHDGLKCLGGVEEWLGPHVGKMRSKDRAMSIFRLGKQS